MLLNKAVTDALNKQVVQEFAAAAQYLAISFYFDAETLPQLSRFFNLQSQEEYGHAMKILNYVADAGAHPIIPATPEPKNHFESAEECVQLALEQELKVTKLINELVDLAAGHNDHLTRQFLQWFVTEQLEEVATMSDLLATIRRAGEHNLLQVEDFLARNPHPEAGSEG